MNKLQTVLDALPVDQAEAIAIVRQMMAQEPVTLHDPIGKVRLVTVHKSYPGYTPPYTHPAPQAVPAEDLHGCACRWDKDDNRVATCVRHQGWLDAMKDET